MWLSTLKYYLRIFSKSKFYSILNVLGLAMGLSIGIVIWLYAKSELTYDQHYTDYKRIYRVSSHFFLDEEFRMAGTGMGMGPLLQNEFEAIEKYTRLGKVGDNLYLHYQGKDIYDDEVYFTDTSYFDLFEAIFIHGDPKRCFRDQQSVVVTESLAQRVFGKTDVLGEVIETSNNWFAVTGVIKDVPENSHIRFSALLPAFMQPVTEEEMKYTLWSAPLFTYVKLKKGRGHSEIEDHFDRFYAKYMADVGDAINGSFEVDLERLDKIHLGSIADFDLSKGNLRYLLTFAGMGLVILLLASINYINMATARIPEKLKEIGVRKVLGSQKKALVFQFLGESVLLSLFALILAISFAELIVHSSLFKSLMQKDLSIGFVSNWAVWIGGVALALLVGLVSGWYPATKMASLQTVQALKGALKPSRKEAVLRRLLVGVQVTASISLVVVALNMAQQLHFIQSKNLGFNKEDVLLIPIQDSTMASQMEEVERQLSSHKDILAMSTSSTIMGTTVGKSIVRTAPESVENVVVDFMVVGKNYFETMQIKTRSGLTFDDVENPNPETMVMVNQAFIDAMGWEDLKDKYLYWNMDENGKAVNTGKVIGVTDDFNAYSLHEEISPLVFFYQPIPEGSIHLRINSEAFKDVLRFLKMHLEGYRSQASV